MAGKRIFYICFCVFFLFIFLSFFFSFFRFSVFLLQRMVKSLLAHGCRLHHCEISSVLPAKYVECAQNAVASSSMYDNINNGGIGLLSKIVDECKINFNSIIDVNGNNPIHLCLLNNSNDTIETVEMLKKVYFGWLKQKNNNNMLPLTIALEMENVDLVLLLLRKDIEDTDHSNKMDLTPFMIDQKCISLIINWIRKAANVQLIGHLKLVKNATRKVLTVENDKLSQYFGNINKDVILHQLVELICYSGDETASKNTNENNDESRIIENESNLATSALIRSLLVKICAKQDELYVVQLLKYSYKFELSEGDEDLVCEVYMAP